MVINGLGNRPSIETQPASADGGIRDWFWIAKAPKKKNIRIQFVEKGSEAAVFCKKKRHATDGRFPSLPFLLRKGEEPGDLFV